MRHNECISQDKRRTCVMTEIRDSCLNDKYRVRVVPVADLRQHLLKDALTLCGEVRGDWQAMQTDARPACESRLAVS